MQLFCNNDNVNTLVQIEQKTHLVNNFFNQQIFFMVSYALAHGAYFL